MIQIIEHVFCRAWAAASGMSFGFNLLTAAIGVIMFAAFRYCDPIKDGVIFSNDQVMNSLILSSNVVEFAPRYH